MIEMTVQEMLNCISVLRTINDKKMPARTAYQFARIIREVDNELKNFQDTRYNLIERYGKKDENGELIEDERGNIEIFPEKKKDFDKESNDLLASKIHINCEQINLEDILDNEFSPNEIGELLLFIKE